MASDIDSSISPTLLALLRCPESGQPLTLASPEILARLHSEKLRNRAGQPVELPVHAGLVREDGSVLYIVRDGIPIMLIDESVPLPPGMAPRGSSDNPLV